MMLKKHTYAKKDLISCRDGNWGLLERKYSIRMTRDRTTWTIPSISNTYMYQSGYSGRILNTKMNMLQFHCLSRWKIMSAFWLLFIFPFLYNSLVENGWLSCRNLAASRRFLQHDDASSDRNFWQIPTRNTFFCQIATKITNFLPDSYKMTIFDPDKITNFCHINKK